VAERTEDPDHRTPADDAASPAPVGTPNSSGGISRSRLYAALSLPVVVIIAVIIGGVIWSKQQPAGATEEVAVVPVSAPGAAGTHCSQLMTALPKDLTDAPHREAIGDPAGTAVWGDPPIILRCGLPTPAELTCSSALTQVSNANGQPGVQWLQLSEGGQTTYLAADRPVRIALTLPDGAGTGTIQQISSVISGIMPSTAGADGNVCTAGKLPATDDK
jgi:hypothetical protein